MVLTQRGDAVSIHGHQINSLLLECIHAPLINDEIGDPDATTKVQYNVDQVDLRKRAWGSAKVVTCAAVSLLAYRAHEHRETEAHSREIQHKADHRKVPEGLHGALLAVVFGLSVACPHRGVDIIRLQR